jgi:hypothetical protein
MARLCGAILFVALLAATTQAAPAPFPKPSATPTLGQLQKRLMARGIVVERVERHTGQNDDWVVHVRLLLTSRGSESFERRITWIVPADGADERGALRAMLATGRTAAQLSAQEPIGFVY